MRERFCCLIVAMVAALSMLSLGWAQETATFVGSKACANCHAEQYGNFRTHSAKAKSDHGVRLMLPKLTEEEQRQCYECHTTGYGQPGGFISFEKTPDLGHVGCESCHGPGSKHVWTGDPADLAGRVSLETCRPCHDDPRVQRINFRPLLHAGAH
jgi:formate-dependent nitrite reductase cytochrome c552 subunit